MANTALESVSASPIEQGAIAQQLVADAQRPAGDTKVAPGSFNSVNIDRQLTDDGAITRYPNGVKVITGGPAEQVTAPPGGQLAGDGQGGMVVYDAKHRVVANMDKDRTVHIHSKNGEYTETPDGKVSFKPAGQTSDLRSLHKPGVVHQSKYEDYGMSTDGTNTQFPNGIEYNPKTGNVQVPPDYPNFSEVPQKDKDGHVVSRNGYDGNGKLLYTVNASGIHVPTSDGTVSQNGGGTVTFKPNETPGTKTLPKVEIMDPLNPNSPCYTSNDPICGLDMGKF